MRSVSELRSIYNLNMFFASLSDAEAIYEPRFWMDFDEWCEFVESDENFDRMAKRERLRLRPQA